MKLPPIEEDSFPTTETKGVLSTSMGEYGEQMAPQEGEHTDEDTTHSDVMIQAMKAGDVESFRDALKAFIRNCIRDYGKSED